MIRVAGVDETVILDQTLMRIRINSYNLRNMIPRQPLLVNKIKIQSVTTALKSFDNSQSSSKDKLMSADATVIQQLQTTSSEM